MLVLVRGGGKGCLRARILPYWHVHASRGGWRVAARGRLETDRRARRRAMEPAEHQPAPGRYLSHAKETALGGIALTPISHCAAPPQPAQAPAVAFPGAESRRGTYSDAARPVARRAPRECQRPGPERAPSLRPAHSAPRPSPGATVAHPEPSTLPATALPPRLPRLAPMRLPAGGFSMERTCPR